MKHQGRNAELSDFPRERLLSLYGENFPLDGREPVFAAEAPGRLEIAGNHTDHQGGVVISAAMHMKAYGIARRNGSSLIKVEMDGFGRSEIDLSEYGWEHPREEELETSTALIRGMAAAAARRGARLSGFDMATCSDVPVGCGVSSSAAFEMLLGIMIQALFDDDRNEGSITPDDPVSLALEGVEAENTYFGKPSGAQDQLASAHGGAVFMDFSSYPPTAEPIGFVPEEARLALCLIDSRLDHAMFGDEFALVTSEMHEVARYLGCEKLGEIPVSRLLESLSEARRDLGDRPVLRALHFYDEVERVRRQRINIIEEDWARFMDVMKLSGSSSAEFLQNISPLITDGKTYKSCACNRLEGIEEGPHESEEVRAPASPSPYISSQQPLIILSLCEHLLSDCGAWRIHGGGFGGSVVAIMPEERIGPFGSEINGWLGYDAVMPVRISRTGARAWRLGQQE